MDLDDRIARLELRAEQLGIHLQDLSRNAPEARQVRSKLYAMLQELAELKTEQARRCLNWNKPSCAISLHNGGGCSSRAAAGSINIEEAEE
jgi:hypothetical protein